MTPNAPTTYVTFTTQARKVMLHAAEEARRSKHPYVGPEHILLALLMEQTGAAASALAKLGMDPQLLSVEAMKFVQPGANDVPQGMLPQTASAKRAIEFAIQEAQSLPQTNVGTGQLLLGLLRVRDGLPAEVFANLNVNIAELRDEVAKHADTDAPTTQITEGLPPLKPLMQDNWSICTSEPTAMQVFIAWEKLRVIYNVLMLAVFVGAFWRIAAHPVWLIVIGSIYLLIVNLPFCFCHLFEMCFCWWGFDRVRSRIGIFVVFSAAMAGGIGGLVYAR